MQKKLYRISEGKKISGVCAGIAEYLSIDVTIVRLLWAVFTILTAFMGGIAFYIICVFVIPEVPRYIEADYKEK